MPLPVVLIMEQMKPSDPPTPHINPETFERSITKVVSLEIVKTYESIIADIEKAKSLYEQANKIARAAAQKEYEANVKLIRSQWETDHAGDPPPTPGTWPGGPKIEAFAFEPYPRHL